MNMVNNIIFFIFFMFTFLTKKFSIQFLLIICISWFRSGLGCLQVTYICLVLIFLSFVSKGLGLNLTNKYGIYLSFAQFSDEVFTVLFPPIKEKNMFAGSSKLQFRYIFVTIKAFRLRS